MLISSKSPKLLMQDPCPLTSPRLGRMIRSDACPVFLCIGTDRIIGDALGPMVGSILEKEACSHLPVYGTLQQTVHALNLDHILPAIKKKHPGQLIIAIDASLGTPETIGTIWLRPHGLQPGAGVSKNLPSAGDLSITGIVGSESTHPYLDLQTTRLSTVASMAERIATIILEVYKKQAENPQA
jgi:putative sporulation protein YyaC